MFSIYLLFFIIKLFNSVLAITNETSQLDYTPQMMSNYLAGSGSQAYTSGTTAAASPYWEYPAAAAGIPAHRPWPIDPWRQHRYDYWDPVHDLSYGRTDYYWLIPVAFIIGIGALLLPVFSLFFTAMVTTGTINLTAGRRKRSALDDADDAGGLTGHGIKPISILVKEVHSALSRFGTNSHKFKNA